MMEQVQSTILVLLVIAGLLPLAGSAAVLFFGRWMPGQTSGWAATSVVALSALLSVVAAGIWMSQGDLPGTIAWNVPWIPIPGANGGPGYLYLGAMIDSLTVAMMAMVSVVAALVHLYSVGYMQGDAKFSRFFAYLSLFTFAMMGIVLSNNLIMLLVFWELVGLTSYLLIGFWYEKPAPQAACTKAFVMNRIGDAGFLVGLGMLFYQVGGSLLLPAVPGADGGMFQPVLDAVQEQTTIRTVLDHPPLWLTVAGIGLFFGAMGKSAQFPLHTWLPDAMEGPTPVSSIVHSATMVAAGVYLTARIFPILTPNALLFIATVGLITLTMAAAMALVMTDIKRVLAYSTLSQLGYMILGVACGAWTFALYHLIVHAFFKCCLFQCAGSVIHACHHEQDMRKYGGLWRKMPITAASYAVASLALAGAAIPLSNFLVTDGIGLSGFYSKDGIIAGAINYGSSLKAAGIDIGPLFYFLPLAVAYVTPLYMARSFALTFLGKPRDQHIFDHAHEAPGTMKLPQVILATLAVISVPFLLWVWPAMIEQARGAMDTITQQAMGTAWTQPGSIHEMGHHAEHLLHQSLLYGAGWILAVALGIWLYRGGLSKPQWLLDRVAPIRWLHIWAVNKFYFDDLYDRVAVGLTQAVASILALMDHHIIDGLVRLAGQMGVLTARASQYLDRKVLDWSLTQGALMTVRSGGVLRITQTGRLRQYVLFLFLAWAISLAIVVWYTLA